MSDDAAKVERLTKLELVDRIAVICAEFPEGWGEGWEWPGKVNAEALEKYRGIARKVIAALAPQPATQGQGPLQVTDEMVNAALQVCWADGRFTAPVMREALAVALAARTPVPPPVQLAEAEERGAKKERAAVLTVLANLELDEHVTSRTADYIDGRWIDKPTPASLAALTKRVEALEAWKNEGGSDV